MRVLSKSPFDYITLSLLIQSHNDDVTGQQSGCFESSVQQLGAAHCMRSGWCRG